MFLKLLEDNPDFRNLYFARYADMFNTTFSCESMIYILDSMVNIIRPEMPRHIARWGGSMFEWESNIKRLRDFIIKGVTASMMALRLVIILRARMKLP
ncbi:MAG: CotH kinase family protein [Saprospiraceae bacterium]|nr:CotH kinase family protein [Saprospiraceae bacterium]